MAPARPCPTQGCPALGPCATHHTGGPRLSATQRGYGATWRAASRAFLAAHPLCADGCGRPATVVDHKVPHRGNRVLMWDRTNWQGLTASCHSRKTATHDGGFGNPIAKSRWRGPLTGTLEGSHV